MSLVNLPQARARLEEVASRQGVQPPATILDEDGVPTKELLAFTRKHGVSLDWLFPD